MATERTSLNNEALQESKSSMANMFNTLFNVTYFTTTGDVLTFMHNVLSNIVWYRAMSWFYLGISIASVCVGGLYMNLCTAQHMIPVYLVVAGSFGITSNLLFMCKWATGSWSVWSQCRDTSEGCRSFWFSWSLWILFWFNMAWFIAGSAWIFGLHSQYKHNYVYEPETHLFVVKHLNIPRVHLMEAPHLAHEAALDVKVETSLRGNHEHDKGHAKLSAAVRDEQKAAEPDLQQLETAVDDNGKATDLDQQHAAAGSTKVDELAHAKDDAAANVNQEGDGDSAVHMATDNDQQAMVDASLGKQVFRGVDFALANPRLLRGAGHIRRHGGLPLHPYCHRGLFEYAFWVTLAEYVMLTLDLLMFLYISCCSCCAYMVVPYASVMQEIPR